MFQGPQAEAIATRFGTASTTKSKEPVGSTLPNGFSEWSVFGSDEVGKGDFFGPLVVAASFVDRKQIALLHELGVRDSKHLNEIEIRRIARDLHAVIPYTYRILHNPEYNQMQRSMTQGKMTDLMHNDVIERLLEQLETKPEAILIDQFADKSVYYKHLSGVVNPVRENVYFTTKEEQLHVAVAASSIIARASFLKEMDKLSESTGVVIPKGTGAKVDQVAASLILRYGSDKLRDWAKVHLANTKKAQQLATKRNRP
jgi:ribonuclease HIII